jgi:hypothetical protein
MCPACIANTAVMVARSWHDNYDANASPDPRWIDVITDPQGAAARRREAEEKECTCS